jgi:hypothetical protein
MTEDGPVLFTPLAHLRFVARSINALSQYVLLQLPAEYRSLCNADQLTNCFSLVQDGKRITAGSWMLGPGEHAVNPLPDPEPIDDPYKDVEEADLADYAPQREAGILRYAKYHDHVIAHLPFAFFKRQALIPERIGQGGGGRPAVRGVCSFSD